jgi:hypothetical protein
MYKGANLKYTESQLSKTIPRGCLLNAARRKWRNPKRTGDNNASYNKPFRKMLKATVYLQSGYCKIEDGEVNSFG